MILEQGLFLPPFHHTDAGVFPALPVPEGRTSVAPQHPFGQSHVGHRPLAQPLGGSGSSAGALWGGSTALPEQSSARDLPPAFLQQCARRFPPVPQTVPPAPAERPAAQLCCSRTASALAGGGCSPALPGELSSRSVLISTTFSVLYHFPPLHCTTSRLRAQLVLAHLSDEINI